MEVKNINRNIWRLTLILKIKYSKKKKKILSRNVDLFNLSFSISYIYWLSFAFYNNSNRQIKKLNIISIATSKPWNHHMHLLYSYSWSLSLLYMNVRIHRIFHVYIKTVSLFCRQIWVDVYSKSVCRCEDED